MKTGGWKKLKATTTHKVQQASDGRIKGMGSVALNGRVFGRLKEHEKSAITKRKKHAKAVTKQQTLLLLLLLLFLVIRFEATIMSLPAFGSGCVTNCCCW
jgi:hypothetical protein